MNQTNQLKCHFCYLTFDDITFYVLFPLILASCETRREHKINDSLHAWPNKNALKLLLHLQCCLILLTIQSLQKYQKYFLVVLSSSKVLFSRMAAAGCTDFL